MGISFSYPLGWLFVCLLASFAATFLLYHNDSKLSEIKVSVKRLLFGLRWLALFMLAGLVLKPFVKTEITTIEKPILAIAVDNSESMALQNDSTQLSNLVNEIKTLSAKVSDKYDVHQFAFGSSVKLSENVQFNQKLSNVSQLRDELNVVYSNRNLAGIILVSDGIVNRGQSLKYAFENFDVPVHTIGVGDSSVQKDAKIANIKSNEIAYLGNDFLVEVSIEASALKDKETEISISKDSKIIESKMVLIDKQQHFSKYQFKLSADAAETSKYSVKLKPLNEEEQLQNNSAVFYVDIIDAKQRILILGSAPHPDIAALNRSLSIKETNQIELNFLGDELADLESYNLVILHNIPSKKKKVDTKELFNSIKNKWIIGGNDLNWGLLRSMDVGFNLKSFGGGIQEATAYVNDDFLMFNISDKSKSTFDKMPPLVMPFMEFNLSSSAKAVLNQKIGPVKTNKPLMYFVESASSKTAITFGEGIWRWRIKDYQLNKSHDNFDSFIQNAAQYLASKEDKSRLRIKFEKSIYENENFTLTAELYDELFELTTKGEVSVQFFQDQKEIHNYKLSASTKSFQLLPVNFPVGSYTFVVKAQLGDQTYSKNGGMVIKKLELEKLDTRANFTDLQNVSMATGGQFFTSNNFKSIEEMFLKKNQSKNILYVESKFFELINIKWIFAIVLLIIGLEWFIRKRKGAY